MNPAAVLGLLGDLYAQVAVQREELDRLRVEHAEMAAQLEAHRTAHPPADGPGDDRLAGYRSTRSTPPNRVAM